MELTTFILSCVAILIASASAWFTWKTASAEKQSATEAKRANDFIAEEAERERQATAVVWETERLSDVMLRLRNEGWDTARSVTVDDCGTGAVQVGPTQQDMLSHASCEILFNLSTARLAPPPELRVTWAGTGSPQMVPVPPVS